MLSCQRQLFGTPNDGRFTQELYLVNLVSIRYWRYLEGEY